jgi:hypothetical protein
MYSSSFFLGLRGTIPELPSSLIADCVIYEPNVFIYWLFVWILLDGITFEKQVVEVPTNCFANCETGSVCSCAKEVNGCNSTVQQQYLPTTATPATTSTLSSTTKQTTTKTTATTKPSTTTTTTKPSTTTTQSTTTLTTQETVTTKTSLTTSTMFTSSRTTNNDLVVVPQSTTKISTTIDESSLDFSIPMIVGIIAGGIVLIVLIGIVLFCLYRKSNNANDNDNNNVQNIAPPPINSNNEYGSVGLANNTGSTDDTQYSEIRLAPQQYVVGDLTL